jgi:hypothetical protein
MRSAVASLVAVGALGLAPSAGAISFQQEGTPYTTGAQAYGVVARDFDGANGPDVVTVNGTSSNLSVFLRQPAGAFAEETGSPFAVGSGPNYAASADFNGDTRPDVAVSNFVTGDVTVLLRQAGGGFAQEAGSPIPLPSPPRASAIAVADFTGDTLPDLVVARYDANMITVLHRVGNSFSAQENYPVGGAPRYLAPADFNGDGLPDLAVADQSTDDLTIMLRLAGGGFGPETPAVVVGDEPAQVVAADFNGDGRPDLAVSNYVSNTVSILLRAPAGGFVEETSSPIPVGPGPIGLAAGDFDDDGAPDLAVASNAVDTVTVLRRTAVGFTPDPVDPISVGDGPHSLTAADFDSDGRLDLAVGHDAASEMRVLLNSTPAPPPPDPDPDPDPDTDGDGVLDSADLCPTVPANTADGCPPGPLPEPVLGETANAAPVAGEVLVGIPTDPTAGARVAQKGVTFVPLTEARQIPVGSFLDTTKGTVSLRLARNRAGDLQSGRFAAGLFQVLQSRKRAAKGLTELQLKGSAAKFRDCRQGKRGARADAARLSRRAIRRLRARARGRYRTRGRHSAATVRGTTWTVVDRCDGTLTKVKRGKVAVRDFRLKETIVLTRGKRYLARRPE